MNSLSGQEKSGISPLDTEANLRSRGGINTPTSTTPPSVPPHRFSPASSISNADFGPLSPYTTDRVFPIRSVVNIEPRKHAAVSPGGTTRSSVCSTPANDDPSFKDDSSNHSVFAIFRSGSINGQDGAVSSVISKQPLGSGSASENISQASDGVTEPTTSGFYTAKHKHIESKDGHMIVTGINGSEAIQACEDEPIHIPGAVQRFGCLVAFTELDDGILDIRVVSEVG